VGVIYWHSLDAIYARAGPSRGFFVWYTNGMNWWVLRWRVHSSWLIMIASLGFMCGVWLTLYIPSTVFESPLWAVAGVSLVVVGMIRGRVYVIPFVILASMIIGAWRGSIHSLTIDGVRPFYGQVVQISGVVSDDVDTDAGGQLIMRIGSLTVESVKPDGTIWISAEPGVDIKRGDRVSVKGKLELGFGSFVGSMYRAKVVDVKRPQPGDVARVFRDWFADGVRVAVPNPQATLGIGYLVGQKHDLPADLIEALKIAGLTHVIVASGYNLTILVRLARRLFEKVSKYLSALAASAMIVGFVAVTGLSPSMTRAGLVAGLSLAAWYYGRRFHPLVLLSFAAAITVAVNPGYIAGDLGWQLSFAAFGGVMILAPLLQRYLFGDTKPGIIRQILGETVAALIVTAPIIIGAFGQFSNVAIIANLLVLPLVPLAMLLTFIAGISGLAFPQVAVIIGAPASWLLGYMINVAQYLSHLSWATSKLELNMVAVMICYVVIIGVCVYLWRVTKYDLRDANIVE